MITAKFGSKKFEVSPKKIYTPDGVSIAEELNLSENEVSGKKPTVSVKGLKLQSLSFEVKLDSRFVDVATELQFWQTTLQKKTSQLFDLGSYRLGKFYLTKYDVKNITLNKKGVYTSALLSLSFTEDGAYTNSKNTITTTTKSTKTKWVTGTKSKMKKGIKVKPKSGKKWYYTAQGAIKRTGKSGTARTNIYEVTHIYQNGKAINCGGLGWMIPSDVYIQVTETVTTTTTKTTTGGGGGLGKVGVSSVVNSQKNRVSLY